MRRDRGGEAVRIRSARPEDAPAVLDLIRDVAATTEFLAQVGADAIPDPTLVAAQITAFERHPLHLALVAEADGSLVGSLRFTPGAATRNRHTGSFFVQVRSTWRGRGVGRALIESLLAWARAHPSIEKVSLGVFATNAAAIGLYRSLGFVEEGRAVREFRLGPGRYVDDVKMYVWVK